MRNPLDSVAQQIGSAIDVGAIADAVRAAPRIAESLERIVESVDALGAEVRAMHADVVELQGHVDAVTTAIAPLGGKLDRLHEDVVGMRGEVATMSQGVSELVPLVEDLRGTMHPLRRTLGLFSRRDVNEAEQPPPASEAEVRD